jgi:hypothetical protein
MLLTGLPSTLCAVDDKTTIENNAEFDGQNAVFEVEVVNQTGMPDVNVTITSDAQDTSRCGIARSGCPVWSVYEVHEKKVAICARCSPCVFIWLIEWQVRADGRQREGPVP